MAFGNPPAFMGYVGFVRFEFPGEQVIVRANSADIRLDQDITKPEVIDGRWDKSVYQLGPKIVEGSINFPSIAERSGRVDPTARLYIATVGRETTGGRFGRIKNQNFFNLGVKYTTQFASFRYKDCIIDSFNWSAAQSEGVTVNVDLIGRTREPSDVPNLTPSSIGFPTNSRVITWNDVIVEVQGERGAPNVKGDYVRNFDITINNNAERYYTFNGKLFPQDIAARKRDIEGSMVILGRHEGLGEHARTNQDRCFESSNIKFGYSLIRDECNAVFLVTMPNIIFRIEELALTNDLFETTINFLALPDDIDLEDARFLEVSGAVT